MLYATHALVDLAAIRHNLRQVRQQVGERAILVALKANGYGHGAARLAQLIQDEGLADAIGVATVPEALELRQAGLRLPMLKFSPVFAEEAEAALRANLTLTIVDNASARTVAQCATRLGRQARVHLAIDTGMRRIGVSIDQARGLAQRVSQHEHLGLEGVFTHLPISDAPVGNEFTRTQLTTFLQVVDQIQDDRARAGQPPMPWVHASNSGAILGHDLSGLTMVRPGIMVYGYYPDPQTPRTLELRQAIELKSRVSFVKQVPAGDTVGYGRSWTAPEDTWVATVPIGYADGFSRLNSNRGRMLVGGASYPVVGRVCMDQTMINLGPDEPTVRVGDEVVVLGRSGQQYISTDEMADLMGTITYEVTCLIAPRVTRCYRDADSAVSESPSAD